MNKMLIISICKNILVYAIGFFVCLAFLYIADALELRRESCFALGVIFMAVLFPLFILTEDWRAN
jgi:hypothetical protein